MPIWPGRTASTPPPTPLLAGNPTSTSHLPAPSYIPHVAMTLRTCSTPAGASARSWVSGLTPLFAIVAAIRLRSRQVTSIEH